MSKIFKNQSNRLPSEWGIDLLGAIAKGFFSGGTPSTKNEKYWQGSIPWITSKWISARLYIDSGEKNISEDAVAQSATTIVPRNSLVFATRVGVGKVAINRLDLAINQDVTGILFDSVTNDLRFLAYQLRSSRIQNLISSYKRGATIQGITRENLKKIEVYRPPLNEQRKIAEILELVQRAIEQQERLIALTTELKKALMHKLFTEGTRGEPQKETEIGPVSESWSVCHLKELLMMTQYGLSVKGSDSGNYAMLRMTNQNNGRITDNNLQYVQIGKEDFIKFKVEPGDILFNRTNSFELVGRTAIFNLSGDFVFASYLIRVRTDKKKLNPYFLNHYLNWDKSQLRLKGIATRAISQSNISATRLGDFLIPVPQIENQEEIVSILDLADSRILQVNRIKNQFQCLFTTLLHQLMTAQIRVNDIKLPELEV